MIYGLRNKLLWSKSTPELRSSSPLTNGDANSIASRSVSERPLFRQEVLEFQRYTRQWGRVVPLQPLPVRFTVWLIALTVAAAVAFLFLAQYARKESALGYLVPSAGSARVFAQQQ